MANPSVEKVPLYVPTLEELELVLQNALSKNFAEVEVRIVSCPDLSKEPFCLKAQGIGGKPRILDVGGVPNLVPSVKYDKVYDLDKIAALAELPGAFLIGAGAGPFKEVGTNCEMMANVMTKSNASDSISNTNGTFVSYIDKQGKCVQNKLEDNCRSFALMANLFASEGKTSRVLQIKVKTRIGKLSFVDAVRLAISEQFGEKTVGIGGTFAVLNGKARMHVMPDFSSDPLNNDEEVNNWLKFFNMTAPLICIGVCFSRDPGYDLRIEHFHGFSQHGEGGHYHEDTTPDEIEYLAYFNAAEFLYRIDRPRIE